MYLDSYLQFNEKKIIATLSMQDTNFFNSGKFKRLCIRIYIYIYICTMLLEQIKGFYHGITKIFLLIGSYTMLSWHF